MQADRLRQALIEHGSPQSTLVYGICAGKTRYSLTILKEERIERAFMFSLDKGFESALFARDNKGEYILNDEELSKLTIYTCEDLQDVPRAWDLMKEVIDYKSNGFWISDKGEKSLLEKKDYQFFPGWKNLKESDCVIVDHLTLLGNSIHNHTIKTGNLKTKSGARDTQREYGEDATKNSSFLQVIQHAKFPTICIAQAIHEEEKDSKLEGAGVFPFMGTKNFSRTVPSFFQNVLYMTIDAGAIYAKGSTPIWRPNVIARSRRGVQIEKSKEYRIGELMFTEAKEQPSGIKIGVNK